MPKIYALFWNMALRQEPSSIAAELPDQVWVGNNHVSSGAQKLGQKRKLNKSLCQNNHSLAKLTNMEDPRHL